MAIHSVFNKRQFALDIRDVHISLWAYWLKFSNIENILIF